MVTVVCTDFTEIIKKTTYFYCAGICLEIKARCISLTEVFPFLTKKKADVILYIMGEYLSFFNDIPPHHPSWQARSSPIPRIQIDNIISDKWSTCDNYREVKKFIQERLKRAPIPELYCLEHHAIFLIILSGM